MKTENTTRVDVIFHGRVQGVGFRFTTTNVAKRFTINGYVMNLKDGTVRMVAEGSRETVSSMIQSVLEAMKGHVTRHDVSWEAPTGEFDGFGVRYS